VLVRQTEPLRAEDDPSEPLKNGDDKVTPNLSGQLLPGAKEVSVFFIAHADQHATDAATLNSRFSEMATAGWRRWEPNKLTEQSFLPT